MTSIDQAEPCPEGFVCGEKTTSFSVLRNPCPGGFWCPSSSSGPEDFGICPPEHYCPEGTTESTRKQKKCLPGFYCPSGTNAALTADGEYDFIERANLGYVIDAKLEALENCADNQDWLDRYAIETWDWCPENELIPEKVQEAYSSLQCPEGTTSDLGSECLGQCWVQDLNWHAELMNPFQIVAGDRILEEESNRVTIDSMSMAIIKFNWNDLDVNFRYNEAFSIKIYDTATNETLPMPNYFDEQFVANNQNDTFHSYYHTDITLTIFNWDAEPQTIDIFYALLSWMYQPMFDTLLGTAEIFLYSPNRAQMGTTNMNVMVLLQTTFEEVGMPYNLVRLQADSDGTPRDPMIVDVGSNIEWFGDKYTVAPFDETFWITFEVASINVPYLPFFMGCEHFGDHIYFYELLETMDNCTFVDDAKIVEQLPFTGIFPDADQCDLSFKCHFAENVKVGSSNSKSWYEIELETALFHITKPSFPKETYFETEGFESQFATQVADLADDIIPVNFFPEGGGSGVPTIVEFVIEYYQQTPEVKLITKFDVFMKEYSSAELDAEFPGYTLTVSFRALSWVELIDSFQLEIPVYMLIFVSIAGILLLFITGLYYLHLLPIRHKPKLHFGMYIFASAIPPCLGTLYGTAPVFIIIFVLDAFQKWDIWKQYATTWGDFHEPTEEDVWVPNVRGRLGLSLMLIACTFLVYGASLLIPAPPEEEEEEEEEEGSQASEQSSSRAENQSKSSQGTDNPNNPDLDPQAVDVDDDVDPLITKQAEIEAKPQRDAMLNKRRYFMVICVFAAMFMTLKIEFSFSQQFAANLYFFLLGFLLLDLILDQLLSRIVLNEALLVAPLLASFVVNEMIMTMAAENFREFVISHIFSLALMLFGRLYLNPLVERIEHNIQHMTIRLMARFKLAERLFKKLILKQLAVQFSTISQETRKDTGSSMEGLLGTMMSYCSQTQAIFMGPFVITFIYFFSNETQIPKDYSIRQNDLIYYLLFSVMFILPQLIIDVLVFHVIEALYGYKLYDYFSYCSYRFKSRIKRLLHQPDSIMDKSLLQGWRSIDNMCYSSQFYFPVTLASWGIIFLSISWLIMIRNGYNPFNDPTFVALIMLQVGFQIPIKFGLTKISQILRIWNINPPAVFSDTEEEEVVKMVDDYVLENNIQNKIKTGMFKHKFVQKNKTWIISNLYRIDANNRFLKELYHKLAKMEAHIEIARKKEESREFQLLALTHAPEPQKDEYTPRTPPPDPDLDKQKIVIMHDWIKKARFNLYLKNAIKAQLPSLQEHRCEHCGSEIELKIKEIIPFNDLLFQYTQQIRGLPIRTKAWLDYYLYHQEFKTLCIECDLIFRHPRVTEYTKIAEHALEYTTRYPLPRIYVPPLVRKFAIKWLLTARSNLYYAEEEQSDLTDQSIVDFSARSISFALSNDTIEIVSEEEKEQLVFDRLTQDF